jgi:hypothetical protein
MRLIKAFPLNVLALLAGVLLCSTALLAQKSAVPQRITTDVNELSLATLRGNVPHLARAEFDQGEAAPSTQLTHVRLVLSRSSEQQAALDAYLAQLQDKSSPNYHKWLTPEQFGQLYGPADSDIAALVAWLESHGLQVETVSKGRTNIAFNGTVHQVEEAFHTSIHSFLVNGGQAGERQFYSNTTDPQIPSALATVVKGVAQLNTIRPRPHFVRGSAGKFNPATRRLEQANGQNPNLTETGGGDFLYIVPGDAATIYDTPNSFNANFTSGTSYTGAGVNIGLGGDATIIASIVGAYRSMFLGSSTSVNLNYCTTSASCSTTPGSGYDASDADEAYIDTELSGGMAPGATIYYYASADLYTGIEAAIDQNLVSIFSLSFGDCEQDMGGTGSGTNEWFNSLWLQAAGQGIAVMVSAGDSGSAGCDYPSTNSGRNVPDASGGLAVSGYASTPYNIAVGGTDLAGLSTSFSTYASTSQGSSATFYRTALKYIPESTWNDSTTVNTTISANVPSTSTNNCAGGANIVAGSGGASVVYPKPSWQAGTGVPSDGKRDLPDVAFMSGNGCEPATWLVCTNDRDGKYTTDCETQSNNEFYFTGYGGTSTASPVFAGILALVEQKTGSRLGMPATVLYGLYNGANSNLIFHDQNKVGNNSVPCTSSSLNCVENAAGHYFESGYNTNATGGYDLATGMGSVDATQLVNYWNSSTGSAAATVSFLSLSPSPVTTIEPLIVTISVSGASGTPTGTISLSGGSYNSSQTIGSGACSAASCAFTIPAGDLAIGSDTLTVTYGGNSTYAVTTNLTTATVNGLNAAVTITSPTSGTGINSNQQLTVSGTVACTGTCTGSTPPSGTVTLTGGGYTSPATAFTGGSYSILIPYNSLSAGSDTLTVTYNGSPIYDAGAFGTTSVTVTYVAVSTPTVNVAPASGSIDSSQTYNVTVTVSGASSLESSPTGTVTLTSGSYNSGPYTLGTAGCTSGSCVSITIPANGLSNGSDTLTATYSGDADYASGTGTASVTVTKSAFALQATNIASLAPGAITGNTSTITVSSATLYLGTVTLTCALTSGPSNTSGDNPSCSNGSNTVTLNSGTASGTATITVYTTAATSELLYPRLPGRGQGNGRGLSGAGGGAVLAFLLFLGIPARRRSWRSMLGILVMMTALGSLAACGGGGGGGGGNSGTTAGTYTFTVTGTGNPTVTPAPTTTFTVYVN